MSHAESSPPRNDALPTKLRPLRAAPIAWGRLALVALLLTACATEQRGEGEGGSPELCQQAADHMAACVGGDPAPEASGCDAEEADRLLDMPCEVITGGLEDSKADLLGLRATACEWGVYRYCAVPACDPVADEPASSSLPAMPEGGACLDQVRDLEGCGVCAYYLCREPELSCGSEGYIEAFAHKYCERYRLVAEPQMSPEARAWLNRIRRCLIEELERFEGDTCEDLKAYGFASHPGCYVETGFCDLSPRDWLLVMNTVDYADLDLSTMIITGVDCLREWL